MLSFELLGQEGILQLQPHSPLRVRDFAEINEVVNRYLCHHPSLSGLLICSNELPGWEDLADLIHHLDFVDHHHKSIRKIAAVADHLPGRLLAPLCDHFSGADVRSFPGTDLEQAKSWLQQPPFTPPRHPDRSHSLDNTQAV